MLGELPTGTRRVIELGGGTGVFTAALLDHGIRPRDLLVLELNEDLHQHLAERFADAHVVCGDAKELPDIVARCGFDEGGTVDAVLSGLGLLSMGRETQQSIVEAAFRVLAREGRLIQFTYGPTCPIRTEVLEDLALTARRGSVIWRNMPPATVWVFTRSGSQRIRPTPMRAR
nr:methyltransferase domain-containing protein [Lysobacter sp. CAU 1642]